MAEICDTCATRIDYSGVVYKIDIQKWLLDRATGHKLTLCPACGHKAEVIWAGGGDGFDNAL